MLTEKELTKEIKYFLHDLFRKSKDSTQYWEQKFKWLKQDLENDIEFIQANVLDYREEKLTINMVEQEGYLRALKTILYRIDRIIDEKEDDNE